MRRKSLKFKVIAIGIWGIIVFVVYTCTVLHSDYYSRLKNNTQIGVPLPLSSNRLNDSLDFQLPINISTRPESVTPRSLANYKHILLYSHFYGDVNWGLGTDLVDQKYFEALRCPVTTCIITSNQSYLSSVAEYDSILFFAHNMDKSKTYPPTQSRRPEQIYVLGMLESPPHTPTFRNEEGMFNWTMSYRFDSDVFWPYGYFVDLDTHAVVSPAIQPIWKQSNFSGESSRNITLKNLIESKKKMAAWFASNFYSIPSKRKVLVEAMQKYISIDIYGWCGNLTCNKSMQSSCQQMLERDYKFYLSFENSLCSDYITEKVFSNMNYYILPVVYNGADNSRFLPPHSYVDVNKFPTVKALTDHLTYLAEHPEEYIKYFWWKEFYYVRDGYNFCDLCVKLHEQGATERLHVYHQGPDKWIEQSACLKMPPISWT